MVYETHGYYLNRNRPVGKPRTRWEDIIWRKTSQILGIQGWRRQETEKNGGHGPEWAVAPKTL
jgi:hypothetical protein